MDHHEGLELDMNLNFLERQTDDTKTNENPELRTAKLQKLRDLVQGSEQLSLRQDDEFLVRFLRAKQYNVSNAFNTLKHYCTYKEQNHQSMVYDSRLRSILESGVVRVLGGRDQLGRRVLWVRVGLWVPRTCPNDTLLLAGNLCTEVLSLEPVTQMAGLVVIFDLKGMGLQQLRGITPAFARRMVHYLANSSPVRVYSVHIVNEPALFTMLFAVYQKLLDERMKRRLFFHGHSLASLHQHVSTNALPSDLGGTLPEQKPHQWLNILESEEAHKELKAAGYILPDEKYSLSVKESHNSNSELKINTKTV